ncbi:MAG: tetratricopeptide repeat protein [Sandaracinaceae bacterium]|nr:tetratricopeptide repeat protein [Sandaracinaceae bacterium]
MPASSRSESSNVIHVDFGRGARVLPGAPSTPVASPPESPPSAPTAERPPKRTRKAADEAPERERPLGAVAARKRDPTGDLFARAEVARLFGLPESRLRYWDRTGFLTPSGETDGRRLYTFQDLIGVRAAKALLERGTPLRRVRRSIESLRATLPHVIRPLAELRISSEGDRVVVQTERAKWEPSSGQLVLDFDVRDLRDEVVRVLRPDHQDPARRRAAYESYLEGARLDEEPTTYDRAEAAYRRAIELDPSFGHALTNLGNLRFRRGAYAEAESYYRRALTVDPAQPEALYNLGFLASEKGDLAEAHQCFAAAVTSDPAFADAHFNLAMTLDAMGDRAAARGHWRTYLVLEPSGEWAEIARRHV